MASPRHFTGANANLTGGENTSIGKLPVLLTGSESISRWRLSPEEIEQVNRTGDIWVAILTGQGTQPPMKVNGFPLIELLDENGEVIAAYNPDSDVFEKEIRIVENRDEYEL